MSPYPLTLMNSWRATDLVKTASITKTVATSSVFSAEHQDDADWKLRHGFMQWAYDGKEQAPVIPMLGIGTKFGYPGLPVSYSSMWKEETWVTIP